MKAAKILLWLGRGSCVRHENIRYVTESGQAFFNISEIDTWGAKSSEIKLTYFINIIGKDGLIIEPKFNQSRLTGATIGYAESAFKKCIVLNSELIVQCCSILCPYLIFKTTCSTCICLFSFHSSIVPVKYKFFKKYFQMVNFACVVEIRSLDASLKQSPYSGYR